MEKQRYKIVFAFDGTRYAGYQFQANGLAVQQVIEEKLAEIEAAPVRIFGCSRTDAGVHAREMAAHFDLTKPVPPAGLVRGMNARLPPDIRILSASIVAPDFNARNDARGKEYRYFLYNAPILPPHLAPFWAWHGKPLNLAAMREGARHFVGTQDFAPFAAKPKKPMETTVRTIVSFDILQHGPRITFIVRGTGFLYKQVRGMVGCLINIGAGREKPSAVRELIDNHIRRTARVPTAPANGLFLWKVFYRRLNPFAPAS